MRPQYAQPFTSGVSICFKKIRLAPPATMLASSVIPGAAVRRVAQRAARVQQEVSQEPEQFAPAVEAHFAVARMQRISMENQDLAAAAARQGLEALEEIQLFRCVEILAEAPEPGKRGALAEDEGSGAPAGRAAERIPRADSHAEHEGIAVGGDGAAPRQDLAALDGRQEFLKQSRAGRRIRVHERQPLPRSGSGTRV